MVLDNSALVEVLRGERPGDDWLRRLVREDRVHAPHLIDLEFVSVLRGFMRSGRLTPEQAHGSLSDFAALRIERYPHEPFLPRIWELAPNLTAYDAAYVALAEELEMPLVTADARLARSAGHEAQIELV